MPRRGAELKSELARRGPSPQREKVHVIETAARAVVAIITVVMMILGNISRLFGSFSPIQHQARQERGERNSTHLRQEVTRDS